MTHSGALPRDKPGGPGARPPAADPSAPASAGAAMSGPDVLLATKLHVPRPQPGFVPRRRLAEALGEALARGRVLVCAPAGFGKTALLADWARDDGRPVAWLGLDDGDSDPARFWRYAVAALDRARPGLAGRVGPLLGPPPPRQALAQRLRQTRARHKTRLRPGHMQLGRQQDVLPGQGNPGRGRHGRVSPERFELTRLHLMTVPRQALRAGP